MTIDNFTPQLVEKNYWTFLVEAKACTCCSRPTLPDLPDGPFPAYFRVQFSEQRERAGIQAIGSYVGYGHVVCRDCKSQGKVAFECVLCKHSRPLSHSERSFGDPSEHLCVTCYETVPAKQWREAVKRLEEEHRYDFE